MSENQSLVSTDWLEKNLGDPSVRILDGSWHLPNDDRNALTEFNDAHIPGALFFDIDEIANLEDPLPHMLPGDDKMSSRIRSMGIKPTDHVVIYDNSLFSTAARVWFMLKNYGHEKVSILDGGLPKWIAEKKPLESDVQTYESSHYTAKNNTGKIRNREQILANIETGNEQVVDARANRRYLGLDPEPRPEAKSGHIPGSLNVPFASLLNENGTYKNKDELKTVFKENNVDLSKPIITSCGSGVTACVLLFALDQIGHQDNALYDGSWSEWGTRTDTPIEK